MIEATKGRRREGGETDTATRDRDRRRAARPVVGEAGVVCLRIRNESSAPTRTPRVTALTARRVVDPSIVSVGLGRQVKGTSGGGRGRDDVKRHSSLLSRPTS